MRCIACNSALSDYEATRRHAVHRGFLDTCNACLKSVGGEHLIPTLDRKDLLSCEDIDDYVDNDLSFLINSPLKDSEDY